MQSNSGFIAYPGKPSDLASEIKVACKTLESSHGLPNFKTWEENDIAGRFLVDPILENIQKSDILVADITKFNFNVAFEIGYAIGAKKRVVLIKRSDIVGDHDHTLGIFDTLGYIEYSSGVSLAAKIKASLSEPSPLRVQRRHSSGRPRVFLLEPHAKVSYDIALKSALKKSKIGFESYDPVERGRLAAGYAIESVSREDALIARFLPSNRTGSLVHNIRVAFCAGIAHSLGREFLLFQESEDPVPLDYRDLVKWVPDPDEISRKIGDLLLRLFDTIGGQDEQTKPGKESLISKVHFGSSIAENEGRDLDTYYLTTESFMEAERGSVQVVAGRKGAGKTAFFIQLRNSLVA